MDLVLINCPIHDYSNFPRFKTGYAAPLGLMSIATYLERNGYEVAILDGEAERLAPWEIAQRVVDLAPRFVGVNSFSVNAQILVSLLPLLPSEPMVILGGPHATQAPPRILLTSEYSRVDYIVRGDGEEAVHKILSGAQLDAETGIFDRRSPGGAGLFSRTPEVDVNTVPIISSTYRQFEPYTKNGLHWCDVTISRGCLFSCGFCSGSCRSNGSTYRNSGWGRLAGELEQLESLGATAIKIADDLPFVGTKQLLQFSREVTSAFPHLSWQANMPASYLKTLATEDFQTLADANFHCLTFGVEAGDPETRRKMGKAIREDELFAILSRAVASSIRCNLYYIVGFPGETRQQMRMTLDMAVNSYKAGIVGADRFVSPRIFAFKPMPGSKIWSDLVNSGYSEEELFDYRDFRLKTELMQRHSWVSAKSFSEVPSAEIAVALDEFYEITNDSMEQFDA